ncbi:hypothetical protein [Nocardia mexicana]|uniref:Uncharacterized protein n=1 Tax=Nocardia mexicana TaxID=279262 RepID=A0A370HC82_9NOCA|nr:hypothetical protein [Nocardia mexicana]RDI54542.1 hypothetical protein DFR68_102670 [Nocardia mexicana]
MAEDAAENTRASLAVLPFSSAPNGENRAAEQHSAEAGGEGPERPRDEKRPEHPGEQPPGQDQRPADGQRGPDGGPAGGQHGPDGGAGGIGPLRPADPAGGAGQPQPGSGERNGGGRPEPGRRDDTYPSAEEQSGPRRKIKIAPGEPAPTKPKHYWDVPLEPPPGASPALRSFVNMADTAIQTAVDLLGRGVPVPPPPVDDLLKPVVVKTLGKGKATENYREALAAVQTRQTSLLEFDNQVAKTAVEVAAEKDETLRAIKQIVAELQTKLKAVGKGKLKAPQETKLMMQIADALEQVYKRVDAVYKSNQKWAGGSEGGESGGGQGGGGQAGGAGGGAGAGAGAGGGGIGQLLPMLAMMVPMGIMSLAPLGMQLLQQHQERQEMERQKAEQQKAEQQNAGQGPAAAPPADPNAPVVAAPATPGAAPPPANAVVPAANTPPPAAPAPSTPTITPAANRLRNVTARPADRRKETDSSTTESEESTAAESESEDTAVDV